MGYILRWCLILTINIFCLKWKFCFSILRKKIQELTRIKHLCNSVGIERGFKWWHTEVYLSSFSLARY